MGRQTAVIQPNGFPSQSGYLKVLTVAYKALHGPTPTPIVLFVNLSTYSVSPLTRHKPASWVFVLAAFSAQNAFPPGYTHGLFPHLLQVSSQMSHHQRFLLLPSYIKTTLFSSHPFLMLLYFPPYHFFLIYVSNG